MQIAKDTVVTLNYQVTDSDGNIIDDGKNPLPSPTPKKFRSARGLVTKKVKIPASGIW